MTATPIHSRITSIDLLRGVVIVLMALDHVRDYFHYDAFFYDPTDLTQTNGAIFFTRFITHFCAPVFVFLAGTSAFLVGERRGKKVLSGWLIKRGVWLIIAEITIIKLGWFFQLDFSLIVLQVIWVLGISMIFLAGIIHLPRKLTIALCLLVVFGHDAFNNFQPSESWSGVWSFLHVFSIVPVGSVAIFVGYPMIPWIFVMPLGYYLGQLYTPGTDPEYRIAKLRQIGLGAFLLFVIIRFTNLYGDPVIWTVQKNLGFTIMSFFNVSKYPPSLLYLLVTLGPAIYLLSLAERWKGTLASYMVTVGRVPMFYYIIHIYIIHIGGAIAAMLTGFSLSDMVINVWVTEEPQLDGYGFGLWVVYALWLLLIVGLYPVCKWYYQYKQNHRNQWWLSYL
ncbi:DUF1624 domain-containing protein [Marinoscillum luteum]|uniref:DUF1624 domain-containing protein n=1 Tax=Marinoscillum luteum TaxID=861051 RepID=A0ABW7NA12_9BACT